MTINSLIFDFDGLIIDTETTDVEIWKTIYAENGFEYPIELWSQIIGGWGITTFDTATHLQELTHGALDVEALQIRHHEDSSARLLREPILDGVLDILSAAKIRGLRVAIASSSPRSWVKPHLDRLGLIDHFQLIVCGDDVPLGRTKPHPDIYLKALDLLKTRSDQAIAFEDSPNGVAAANAAGIFVVAVPNPTTALLKINGADLIVDSLARLELDELLELVSRKNTGTLGRELGIGNRKSGIGG